MESYLSLWGGYFSVGVEIMFSKYIQEVAKRSPLSRLLIETGNPSSYSWLLGKKSNNGIPELLFKVIDKVCEIKSICREELLHYLGRNQQKVLNTVDLTQKVY